MHRYRSYLRYYSLRGSMLQKGMFCQPDHLDEQYIYVRLSLFSLVVFVLLLTVLGSDKAFFKEDMDVTRNDVLSPTVRHH